MNYITRFKYLLLAGALVVLAGCKVAVIVVEGGKVTSDSAGDCVAGTVCIHEVDDASYAETFTAVADPGWRFVKWDTGTNALCANELVTLCGVSTVLLAGTAVEPLIASDITAYIQPIFECDGPCPTLTGDPILNTIIANGSEWAPLDVFASKTYAEMATACPAGKCSGLLDGYLMDGWYWASGQQVVDMMNSYGGTFSYPSSSFVVFPTTVLGAMSAAGWTAPGASKIAGASSDDLSIAEAAIIFTAFIGSEGASVGTLPLGTTTASEGYWLFR